MGIIKRIRKIKWNEEKNLTVFCDQRHYIHQSMSDEQFMADELNGNDWKIVIDPNQAHEILVDNAGYPAWFWENPWVTFFCHIT